MALGAGNVAGAFDSWSHLPDRAFRALAYMALVSLDRDDPPRYWGGRGALAKALGLADDEAGHRAVKRAVAQLVRAGAIKHDGPPAAGGRRAEYVLNVGPLRSTDSHPTGGH